MTLALYFQQVSEIEKCFTLLKISLDILVLVEGENHPDIAAAYVTLGYLF